MFPVCDGRFFASSGQDWYSDCSGTITRVDKDGKMCDVKVCPLRDPSAYVYAFTKLYMMLECFHVLICVPVAAECNL